MKRTVFPALILWLLLAPAARAEDAPEPADITNSCAPWDGAATAIALKQSHVRAMIYQSLDPNMAKAQENHYASAPNEPNRGGAEIMVCDDHDADCQVRAGTISLTAEGGGAFTGYVEWMDGKSDVHLPFRGTYAHKQMFCG